MNWVTMHSSWLVRAAYDGGTLFVEFKDGVLCQFDNVPLDMWIDLLGAPSKGQWWHANMMSWPYKVV